MSIVKSKALYSFGKICESDWAREERKVLGYLIDRMITIGRAPSEQGYNTIPLIEVHAIYQHNTLYWRNAVNVTAKQVFFCMNSIHNGFVNPELINNSYPERCTGICNIMQKYDKFNSLYVYKNYQNAKYKEYVYLVINAHLICKTKFSFLKTVEGVICTTGVTLYAILRQKMTKFDSWYFSQKRTEFKIKVSTGNK